MTNGYQEYRKRHGIEYRNPKRFYIVACPTCNSKIGKCCMEVKNPSRYCLPHVKRIAAVKMLEGEKK